MVAQQSEFYSNKNDDICPKSFQKYAYNKDSMVTGQEYKYAWRQ